MIRRIKKIIRKMIPKIYNCTQVIYIKWMDKDWYIYK